MFELFLKECKMLAKSLVYSILIAVIVAFYNTQFYADIPKTKEDKTFNEGKIVNGPPKKVLQEPVYVKDMETYFAENRQYPYGTVNDEISAQIIPRATTRLFNEYANGSYTAYPMGIIKNVKLNKSETKRIEEILGEITGKSIEDLQEVNKNGKWTEVLTGIKIEYVRFQQLMKEADEIIGAGSNYSKENLKRFGTRPRTYEEAMKEYKALIEDDKITNGYARLFSDYIGIVLGLFPVFVVVFYMLRDKKSNMDQLIYCKETSSVNLIISRFAALVTMMMVPVFVLAVFSTYKFTDIGMGLNVSIDYFAFIKYSIGWLMPTVMAVTAMGMFLTILTDSVVGILIQIVWFFVSIFSGGLIGNYGLIQIIVRFNSSSNREFFITNINSILINRLFYIALSAVLLALSVYILNLKREGRVDIYGKFREHSSALQNKFKASFDK